MQCLYCNNNTLSRSLSGIKDHRGVFTKTYSFSKCDACGSLLQWPLPLPQELGNSYPAGYTFKKETGSGIRKLINRIEWALFYKHSYSSSVKFVKKHIGINEGRLLEIGCGSGLRLYEFYKAGFDCTGYDFSEEDINYAGSLEGIKAFKKNIEDEEIPAESFGLIVSNHLIEHLYNPGKLIEKIGKGLTAGGYTVMGIPMIDGLTSRAAGVKWSGVKEVPRHITVPSSAGITKMLEQKGFTNIKIIPASAFYIAADAALTIMPSASYSSVTNKSFLAALFNRLLSAMLMLILIAPIKILIMAGVKQSLSVVLAQKSAGEAKNE